MRARWYSPQLGQFTSHDPLGYIDAQNLYAFAAFDPINVAATFYTLCESTRKNGLDPHDYLRAVFEAHLRQPGNVRPNRN